MLRPSDTGPRWDALKRQIATGLNVGASGLAYRSADIGGGQPSGSGVGPEDAEYAELYARWFEFGAFCPIFLAYSSRAENEVWSYGDAAEKILVKYLRLRYRLLPYIYSLARKVTETGAPFMRALFMDFPQDPEVRDHRDEYMFGPAFLVAPVFEKGKTGREVYLPRGAVWYDYWTGRNTRGGSGFSRTRLRMSFLYLSGQDPSSLMGTTYPIRARNRGKWSCMYMPARISAIRSLSG